MFQSATLKLTGWYVLILMTISLLFSVTIYGISAGEIDTQLEQFQLRYESDGMSVYAPDGTSIPNFDQVRNDQNARAHSNLFFSLLYINLLILIAGGTASYVLARRTLRDIEEVHTAQSRFTSDASHELRTPLAVMKTELELVLRDSSASKAEYREILESNLEEVDKLTRLSHMLLQLSKAEYSELEMDEIELKEVVEQVLKRQPQSSSRIKVTTAKNLPRAHGNLASIEELVMILVDNALKYSPTDSLVTIHLSRRSGKACFEITNTGTGISEQDLPRIFDRFYRADTSRTHGTQSGYGLGLALAKKIVEIHKGELSATSALNHATTFTVLLPSYKKIKQGS